MHALTELEYEPDAEWLEQHAYESAWVELVDAIAEHRVVGAHVVQELGGRITAAMWRDVAEAVQARQHRIARWRATDPQHVYEITYDVAARVARRWWDGDEHAATVVARPAMRHVYVSQRPRYRGRRRRARARSPGRPRQPGDLDHPPGRAGLSCVERAA